MPEAAPHPTSRRSRYGGHLASCPHLDASVAESCTMPPSRPMEPPVPMVTRDEMNFTRPDRSGNRPSPATTTSSMLRRSLLPDQSQPEIQHQPRHETAQRRGQQPPPTAHHLRHLDRIAGALQEELLHRFHGIVEAQIDQAPQQTHPSGQDQVIRLLTEPDSFPDAQQPQPMAAEKRVQRRDSAVGQ